MFDKPKANLNWLHQPQSEEFLDACYSAEDRPLKSPPCDAEKVATVVRQVKIGHSSKELKAPLANAPEAKAVPSASSHTHDPAQLLLGAQIASLLLEKAKALDVAKNHGSIDKGCSSSSLSLGQEEENTDSQLLSKKALTVEPPPLPLPAPECVPETSPNDDHATTGSAHGQVPGKSLEDYEKEAFQRLPGKQHGGKAFKRPACSKVPNSLPKAKSCPKAKAKPGPKAKAKGCLKACDKKQSKPAGNCWGCIRCRGNTSGCSTCKKQGFQGLRLNGRDAWKRWFNSRKA